MELGKKDTTFAKKIKQKMAKIVESHKHDHPLYKPTVIKESVIDEKRKIAVFILFEQIDTDRCTEHGEGYLGDQFRFSLWLIKNDQEPEQLFEDHAYIRPRSKSELTGTRGRDCTLKDLHLKSKAVKAKHSSGEKVEEQKWQELTFKL